MHFNIGKKTYKAGLDKGFLGLDGAKHNRAETHNAKLKRQKSSRALSRQASTSSPEARPPANEQFALELLRTKDPTLIAEQAIKELEESQKLWEKDFQAWSVSWRQFISNFSFERVKETAHSSQDPEIVSLISQTPANLSKKSHNHAKSVDSVHANIAETYNSYASRVRSSDGSNDSLTSPDPADLDEYEISIIEDDINYSDYARDLPDSKHSSRGELHAYHQLML